MKKKVIACIALGTLVLAVILIVVFVKKKSPESGMIPQEQAEISVLKPAKRSRLNTEQQPVTAEEAKETLGVSNKSDTYTNPGFSVRYPSDFIKNINYVYKGFGPGNDIEGISFTIPATSAKGTNLASDSYISFEHINKIDCEAKDFLYGVSLADEDTVKINGIEFRTAHTTEGAAGNVYDQTVFVSDDCLAIRYFIHSTNLANYTEGSVQQFDKDALLSIFDEIRDSYRQL